MSLRQGYLRAKKWLTAPKPVNSSVCQTLHIHDLLLYIQLGQPNKIFSRRTNSYITDKFSYWTVKAVDGTAANQRLVLIQTFTKYTQVY